MHIDYPFQIGGGGRTASTDDNDYVRDLIEQVLFTAPGERVNRPTFGSGILRLVFEPAGAEVAAATQFLVQSALQQWLSDVAEVQAVQVDSQDSTLIVAVRYRPRNSSDARTAVFARPV
jgi:phage baseplate assembly protein W